MSKRKGGKTIHLANPIESPKYNLAWPPVRTLMGSDTRHPNAMVDQIDRTEALLFRLDGHPPTANRLWRPASGRGLAKTRAYKLWKEGAAQAIALQAKGRIVEGPYSVYITLIGFNRRRDIGNCNKPVVDALVEAGVVSDDRYCDFEAVERSGDPKAEPQTLVSVWGPL